ncbi:response regulator [Dongshaea marina]|uniref:response regulator n=1 Tax=Dongshaea marina TaxID=2047966 RepID=UPI000D3EE19A|nr:response regulator [Dongshaea marina]
MISVALIDDHPMVRSGFAQLLELEPDISVIAQYASLNEARALTEIDCDVAVLDISLSDGNGLSLLPQLRSHCAVIMLSVHDSAVMIETALAQGAKGYLSKRCGPDELVQAVRSVASGQNYLPPTLACQLANRSHHEGVSQLTKREREICLKLVEGLEVKAIALELGLSHKTVHVHRANILEKMAVQNTVELARKLLSHPLPPC